MNIEQKKQMLLEYCLAVRRLSRRCNEAASWNDMAVRSGSSVMKVSKNTGYDVGTIKSTAMSIEGEASDLAIRVSTLRNKLYTSMDQMQCSLYRDVLESIYIQGMTREQVADQHKRSIRTINRWVVCAIDDLSKNSDFFKNVSK